MEIKVKEMELGGLGTHFRKKKQHFHYHLCDFM